MKPFDYDECIKNHDGYAVCNAGGKWKLLTDESPYLALSSSPLCIVAVNESIGSRSFNSKGYAPQARIQLYTPEKRIQKEVWLNLYENWQSVSSSRDEADKNARGLPRLACVKVVIDCAEGDGL